MRCTSSARVRAARSVSVTTDRRSAAGIDVEALRTVARERFQVAIAGGLGPLAGRVFRIGHLGDMNPAMILGASPASKRRCACRACRSAGVGWTRRFRVWRNESEI